MGDCGLMFSQEIPRSPGLTSHMPGFLLECYTCMLIPGDFFFNVYSSNLIGNLPKLLECSSVKRHSRIKEGSFGLKKCGVAQKRVRDIEGVV